ncbi:unnamed protein product [Zymoseptoria tritici ST99CH_1E4]|uniref:DUF7908 domain-containing protein n=1 Tax=Zymoseptoria tritici ST99CH_1E4 TaxID=1276532 RepID=A0A2H1FKH1_ZYMTR|nr:unnamed protein product [Zymoseptoria tritici ST99CH_1E4]
MASYTSSLRHALVGIVMGCAGLASALDTCSVERQTVHEQIVSVNTEVLSNTTFYPVPEVAVTITNAPTSLDGITTFRWTESPKITWGPTLTSLASIPQSLESLATAASDLENTSFILMVLRSDGLQIRQQGDVYMGANGTTSNDCTVSPIYAITNGVLTATMNGVRYTYSTAPGLPYAVFNPSTVPGAITTSFALSANGYLIWRNANFFNGQAGFCALQNGTVYAIFQQDARPDGCLYINLSLFDVSSCQALQLSTITGPTGPTGPRGPTDEPQDKYIQVLRSKKEYADMAHARLALLEARDKYIQVLRSKKEYADIAHARLALLEARALKISAARPCGRGRY